MAKTQAGGNQAVAKPQDAANASNSDIEHDTLVKWVNESDDVTIDSRELSEKCRRYYDTDQWTDAERKKLARQKQAATVSNRVKPKMDSLMGMEQTNRTTAKAFPRTPVHEKGAEAATESIRFVLNDNDFNTVRSSSFENMLIEGTGVAEVLVKPKKDGYKVCVNHIPWDRFIYDPHSRRKHFTDARYLGQVIWMDYDEAKAKYPDAADILDTMIAGSATYDDKPRWMDTTRKRVKIVEMYYSRADGDIWYACFTRGGYCEQPKRSPYKNEEGETEWPYEAASLFVTQEGVRYGAEAQLLDMQDEINKRRSKALHLMSVRQVRWEKGAVDDINKARQELAKPDGVLETTPGMEFEILKTGDMAAAQFNLLSEAKAEIDSVGSNAALQGKGNSDASGRALLARESAGKTELAPVFGVLKTWDIRIYRKVWNRIKQYWKAEKWIRVTDDETNLRWVGLNQPITQGEQAIMKAKEQGANEEQLKQLAAQLMNDPAAKSIVSTKNEIIEMDVDIIINEVPDAVSSQIEDFATLGEMVKSGFQIPPMAVIEASPLTNKDRILRMMKESPPIPPQVQQKMQEMQDQMKKIGEEAQKLQQENQQLKTGSQEQAQKIQADQAASAAKIQQQQQETQAQLALEKQRQDAEIKLAREKAMAELQLKRDIATAELEIERMKIDAQSDGEIDKAIATVKNLTMMHETKMQASSQAKQESDGDKSEEDENGSEKMHGEMMKAIADVLAQLTRKKQINLIKRDGQLVGADVTVQ